MLKKFIIPALCVSVLTACSPATPMVEFKGEQVPATTIAEAKALDTEFLDLMCSIVDDETVTQGFVDDMQKMSDKYADTPPVVDNYGNDWLMFDVLSDASQKRTDALQGMVGTPVDEKVKSATEEQCAFMSNALDMAFNDFEKM